MMTEQQLQTVATRIHQCNNIKKQLADMAGIEVVSHDADLKERIR